MHIAVPILISRRRNPYLRSFAFTFLGLPSLQQHSDQQDHRRDERKECHSHTGFGQSVPREGRYRVHILRCLAVEHVDFVSIEGVLDVIDVINPFVGGWP